MKEGKVTRISVSYNVNAERADNVIGRRIYEARRRHGLSLTALAEQLKGCGIDIGKTALFKWENGESVPNTYQFLAVCRLLGMEDSLRSYARTYRPELNPEGLRKVEEYRRDLICSGCYDPEPVAEPVELLREMTVAYMPAAAGTGNWLDDTEAYEVMSFPEDSIPKGAELGIRISGDSMEPAFHDGQIVWVQKCTELNVGEVGIFLYDEQAFIKLYGEKEPDDEVKELYTDHYGTLHRQPVLYSCNAAKYGPIVVSPYNPFRVFGRVLK
jgi:transcriptional regulator with XRE-family HTH domain